MELPNHNLNFDSVKSAWVNERYLSENEFDLQGTSRGFTITENVHEIVTLRVSMKTAALLE